MLRVECEKCKAPYQVDERRIPPNGLKMRCPKCSHTFVVKAGGPSAPAGAAPPAASGAPAAAGTSGGGAAPPAGAPAAGGQAKPARTAEQTKGLKRTMIGVGEGPAASSAGLPATRAIAGRSALAPAAGLPATPAKPPPSTEKQTRPLDELDLPLTSPRKPGAAPAGGRGVAPATGTKAPALAKPSTSSSASTISGGFDLETDLPSPSARTPAAPKTASGGAGGGGFDFELDLPASSRSAADLPTAVGARAELPATVRKDAAAGLPVAAKASVGLPAARVAVKGGPAGKPMDVAAMRAAAAKLPPPGRPGPQKAIGASSFGEIDLPGGDDLPLLADTLPTPHAALPVVSNALPSVSSPLPAVSNALPALSNALPAVSNALPGVSNVLPTTPGASSRGRAADAAPHLSLEMGAVRRPSLRDEKIDSVGLADGLGEFGELDLPPAPADFERRPPLSSPADVHAAGGALRPPSLTPPPFKGNHAMDTGFSGELPEIPGLDGGLDLPPPSPRPAPAAASAYGAQGASPLAPDFAPPSPGYGGNAPGPGGPSSQPHPGAGPGGAPAAQSAESRSTGGMGFGEVDLGMGGDEADIASEDTVAAPAPVSVAHGGGYPGQQPASAAASGGEAAIPVAATRARPDQQVRKSSPVARVALGLLVLTVLGGGALELTPYGAYGRHAVVDLVRAGDYQRAATEVGANARKQLALDVYDAASAASEAASRAHAAQPRARQLTAYAALVDLQNQLRFSGDGDRLTRAIQLLRELPPGKEVRYANVAEAARDALLGDLPKARKGLDAAAKRDVGDPIQEDVAFIRGEVELRAKDGAAASAAFAKGLQLRPGARGHFGLARAHVLDADVAGARKEIQEALAATPNHVGARVLRAQLVWDQERDELAAIGDLKAVLEGELKPLAAPAEQAAAHAQLGWIHAQRGRSAEARANFDAALKVQARNVQALLGQGEVLYSEGRYTEALTRFDTAVQADATNVDAIVSDAKAKLALERLNDAKTQLVAARGTWPKDWRIASWLGKAEQALGNREAAEKELGAAIDLIDTKHPDAIQPYVALASLLAGAGRAKDAQTKLEEARARLPDSAVMQRALGEVAAAQGDYDRAIVHFKSAMEKDPHDISTRFRLGVTLRRMRRMDLAAAEFDKVVASDKDYPGLAVERGLLFEEAGDVDKALEQFQSALAKAPEDPDLQLRVGAAYAAIGRPADAVPILKKVLEKRTNSAEANHYLGRALFQQGGSHELEAMRFLKRAVELDPNRAEYHLYVAWAANNAVPAQLGLARDEIDKALAIDKLLADAYWQRGVLLRKELAVDDAIKDLRHALELRPTRVEAHAALGECYEDKNETGAALAEWQKAVASNDKQPFWRFRLGRLLLERGASADAARHLVYAVTEGDKMEARPAWLAAASFAAGEALRRTGKRAEAIDKYRRFLELAPTNSPDRRDAINALRDLGAPWTL